MIQLIARPDRPIFERELAHMFRERKRVFVDRLHWEVPVVDGEFEIDQFDTEDAVYLLSMDETGAQAGSVRLLPSTRPTLLSEVFPHLCERGVPTGRDVWEITRICTAICGPEALDVRRRLMIGMVEFALLNGIKRFSLVAHLPYLSRLLAIGWDCEPLGLPQPHAEQLVGAMVINITPETLILLRQRAGVTGPVLRREVRDAA